MDFHTSVAGKRFFSSQLPSLIAALDGIAAALKTPQPVFRLEQEVPPDFLTELYYSSHDLLETVDPEVFRAHNAAVISHQEKMRTLLTPEAWDSVEQYRTLLDARAAVEREQAFTTGFQYATKLFAAGLSMPRTAEKSD